MKLFLVVLLSLLSYYGCTGYPTIEIKLPEDLLQENETSIESWLDESNETESNNSLPLDMHGFGKKVKEGIKTIKDKANNFKEKVKGGYDKFKEKVKGGYDNLKDKFKDFKDKIGSKGGGSGGGSGGGYYRDKYDRDYDRNKYDRDRYDRDRYDRDRYDRDYYRKDRDYSGSGISDPNAKWIGLGIGIFMIVGILGILIFFKLKGDI